MQGLCVLHRVSGAGSFWLNLEDMCRHMPSTHGMPLEGQGTKINIDEPKKIPVREDNPYCDDSLSTNVPLLAYQGHRPGKYRINLGSRSEPNLTYGLGLVVVHAVPSLAAYWSCEQLLFCLPLLPGPPQR